jgi:multicomponent Na+:H+ antiporter subunit G
MILMLAGSVFYFIGTLGIARFPDLYTRLQASTLCVVMGASGIILGTILLKGICAASAKALLTLIFLLLTAPVASHAIARAGYLSGVKMRPGSVADDYKSYKRRRGKRQKSARRVRT